MESKQFDIKTESSEKLGLFLIEQMGVLNQAMNTIARVQNNVQAIEKELRGRIPQTTLT